jgi:hypothetical protein
MTRAVRRFENKEERNFSTIWGELFFGQHKKNANRKKYDERTFTSSSL